jgi:hypothetical protein
VNDEDDQIVHVQLVRNDEKRQRDAERILVAMGWKWTEYPDGGVWALHNKRDAVAYQNDSQRNKQLGRA